MLPALSDIVSAASVLVLFQVHTHRLHKTEAQQPILQARLLEHRTKLDDVYTRQEQLKQRLDGHDRLVANTAGRKQQLEGSRGGGPLAPYGHRMEELLQIVNRTRWGGEKPIGPLGVGVKLKDMKYQDVIHTQLGSLLSAFAVTTPGDARQLREIIKNCQQHRGL